LIQWILLLCQSSCIVKIMSCRVAIHRTVCNNLLQLHTVPHQCSQNYLCHYTMKMKCDHVSYGCWSLYLQHVVKSFKYSRTSASWLPIFWMHGYNRVIVKSQPFIPNAFCILPLISSRILRYLETFFSVPSSLRYS
jgi:hypothetical protein